LSQGKRSGHLTFQIDEQASDRSERQVTEFEDQGVDFQEADRRYAEIKRRHEAGTLTDEEFDEQLKELMVQDQEDRWWVKSRTTGHWHRYDGTTWIKDTPPGYQPLRGGSGTTAARVPTSPRTRLPSWLVPVASVGLVAFVGLVIIVVAIARNTGGDSDQARGGGGAAPPDSSPTATSKPTPTSSDLPFSDDFSNTSSGWPQEREKDKGNYYDRGHYRIYSPASEAGITRAVSLSEAGPYQDVAVAVEAAMLSNQSDKIASGVVCRRQDPDNYYSLVAFEDGYVSIVKFKDANLRQIEGEDRSEEIGENVFSPRLHIRGDCVGDTLTLYVEDQKVIEAKDSEFTSGGVGLVVYSGDSNVPANILFDNFSVEKP
jgi:hypothetical protein